MTIFKKSRMAILSFGLMVLVAGYINYKYNPEREKDLGQTVYVNSKDGFTYDTVSIYDDINEKEKENEQIEECLNCDESSITQADLKQETQDDAIAVFKYDRDNMFSELSENYDEIINNANTSKDKINEYQEKLSSLKLKKNLIIMVENVIKSKGIEDVVIIPTENSNYNVIVKSKEEIKKDDIAKIQQTLVDELGADASKITITCKN